MAASLTAGYRDIKLVHETFIVVVNFFIININHKDYFVIKIDNIK